MARWECSNLNQDNETFWGGQFGTKDYYLLISGSELKVGSTGLVRLVAIFNFIFPVILRLLLGGRGQFLGVKEEIFADIPILLGRQNFSVEFHG